MLGKLYNQYTEQLLNESVDKEISDIFKKLAKRDGKLLKEVCDMYDSFNEAHLNNKEYAVAFVDNSLTSLKSKAQALTYGIIELKENTTHDDSITSLLDEYVFGQHSILREYEIKDQLVNIITAEKSDDITESVMIYSEADEKTKDIIKSILNEDTEKINEFYHNTLNQIIIECNNKIIENVSNQDFVLQIAQVQSTCFDLKSKEPNKDTLISLLTLNENIGN